MFGGMPTLVARFDVAKVGAAHCGLECWKRVWRVINPADIVGVFLFDGADPDAKLVRNDSAPPKTPDTKLVRNNSAPPKTPDAKLVQNDSAPPKPHAFCIAFQGHHEAVLNEIRSTLEQSPEFVSVAALPPFLNGEDIARDRFNEIGRIAHDGRLAGPVSNCQAAFEIVYAEGGPPMASVPSPGLRCGVPWQRLQ